MVILAQKHTDISRVAESSDQKGRTESALLKGEDIYFTYSEDDQGVSDMSKCRSVVCGVQFVYFYMILSQTSEVSFFPICTMKSCVLRVFPGQPFPAYIRFIIHTVYT